MTRSARTPTDYEVQLAHDFENLSDEVVDKLRARGLTHSKFAQRLLGNENIGSDRWNELQKYVFDTDDIPGLLKITDEKVYHNRKMCRLKDQMLEKKRNDTEYMNILVKTASEMGSVNSYEQICDFPKTLFYSKKPYATTTIEHSAYWVEGDDLIFLKFFTRYLGNGKIPEDVWLQAKLQLFLIQDHMQQKLASLSEGGPLLGMTDDYCKLNPVLIAICHTPTESRQKVISIEEQDGIPEMISSAAVYFSGAVLPRLQGHIGMKQRRHKEIMPELSDAQSDSEESFVPDQDPSKIEVGTTVYNVATFNTGVVTKLHKATQQASVEWEGSKQQRMRPCLLDKLIVTPVKERVDPSCTGDRVVVVGASERNCIGKRGTITSYSVSRCEVLLDGCTRSRRFSTKLLHCIASKKQNVVSGESVAFKASISKGTDDLNELLLKMGLNFQVVRKTKTRIYQYPSSTETVTPDHGDDTLLEEEDDHALVEEYRRLAEASQRRITSSPDRLIALRDDETLWFNCTEIAAYAMHTNGRLADIYRNLVADANCLQYAWVCQPYLYGSILKRNGDLQRMSHLWTKILDVDLLLVPNCFVSHHWSLLIIGNPLDHQGTFILHLDSISNHTDCVDIESVRFFLHAGCFKKRGETPDFQDVHVESCSSPRQRNSNDCGPYTLACIKSLVDLIEKRVILTDKSSVRIDKQKMQSLIQAWVFSPHLVHQIRLKVHGILSDM